jgi:hypothetical protein
MRQSPNLPRGRRVARRDDTYRLVRQSIPAALRSHRDDRQTILRLSIAGLMLAGIAVHLLAFPIVNDRFFVAHYLAIAVPSVGTVLASHGGAVARTILRKFSKSVAGMSETIQ